MKILLLVLPILLSQSAQASQTNSPRHFSARTDDDLNAKERLLGMPVSQEESAFVLDQNARTRDLLNTAASAFSQQLQTRAAELVPKNAPVRTNYFGSDFSIKDGALMRLSEDGHERLIIPATLLPKDARMGTFRVSPDQTKVAFAYSFFGSDWQTWQIYDIAKGRLLKKDGDFNLKAFSWPGFSWTPDSRKVLYPKDSTIQEDFAGLRNPRIMLHTVGTSQSSDKVIFEGFESPASSRWGAVALDNDSAVVYRGQGVAVIPMAAFIVNFKSGERKPLIEPHKFLGTSPGTGIVGTRNGKVYFRTAALGNNFGIVAVDAAHPNPISTARTIVPSDPRSVLYQALLLGDKIVTQHVSDDLKVHFGMYDLAGHLVARMRPSDFGLPDHGHPSLPFMDGDMTSTRGHFTYSSVGTPPVTFRADVANGRFLRLPDTGEVNFDSSKILAEHVTYASHDGEKIHMLIYRRADQVNRQAKFAYLYSYGFIGIPNLPQWNRKFQLALEMGGIVALPMLRGGGEFGADFQLAGTNNRWHTFYDLVHASRWLKKNMKIKEGRVAVVGRSFGGMTGTVHYVHHQGEFDLISAIVPVTDWREHFNGSGWWMGDDFGIERDSVTGKTSYEKMTSLAAKIREWNPSDHLGKLRGKKLIPVIFFSGQYDTNTTPHQTFRFVKSLQSLYPDQPIYMYQHPNGGHGARAELVDELLFIAKQFNLTDLAPITK